MYIEADWMILATRSRCRSNTLLTRSWRWEGITWRFYSFQAYKSANVKVIAHQLPAQNINHGQREIPSLVTLSFQMLFFFGSDIPRTKLRSPKLYTKENIKCQIIYSFHFWEVGFHSLWSHYLYLVQSIAVATPRPMLSATKKCLYLYVRMSSFCKLKRLSVLVNYRLKFFRVYTKTLSLRDGGLAYGRTEPGEI